MMDALKRSQKFQTLLKKFSSDKKSNTDHKVKVKTAAAPAESSYRRGQNVVSKTKDAPPHELSVRKSARDIRKPQRYDASPKVNGSRILGRSRAEDRTLRAPKPTNINLRREVIAEEEEFLSASMVAKSPQHRSAFSRVNRPKPPDPGILLEPDGRRENQERSYLPRVNYSEQQVPHRDEPTFERGIGYNGFPWPQNARRENDLSHLYSSVRQPMVVLTDFQRSCADMYSSHLADVPQGAHGTRWNAPSRRDLHPYTMRLTDLNQNRNDSSWAAPALHPGARASGMRLADMAPRRNAPICAPPLAPAQPKRDDGFLRPATPPDLKNLEIVAQQEQSEYLEVLEEFANSPYLSAIEIVHFKNKLRDKLKVKIVKVSQQKQMNQSILKGSVCDSYRLNHKDAMVQSWLRSSSSTAQPPITNSQRNDPDYLDVEAKRRRLGTENQIPRHDTLRHRETPAPGRRELTNKFTSSVQKRREDRRRLDRSSPTSHFDS